MEKLIPLVKLLSKQKTKQIEIISEEAKLSVKSKLLYDGINKNEILDDLTAAKILYGKDENYPAYKKLKYRLRQRLINTIFFIDVQEYSKTSYQRALNRSIKNWCAYKIILDKGLRRTAVDIAENALQACLKYDLVELSLLILSDLKMQYGLFIDNKYKYKKYEKLYFETRKTFDFKEKAEHYYIQLGQIVTKSKSYSYDEKVIKIEKNLISLKSESEDVDSYYLKFFIYNALYYLNLIKADNKALRNICQEAIGYFSDKEGFSPLALFQFYQKKGIASLSLKKHEEAITIFIYCFKFKPKAGSLSWQFNYNYLFNCYICQKNYLESYNVISNVINQKSFNKINETYREPWYLKEAFIHFLIKIGKINPAESNAQKLRPFRLARFMNEVSMFSNDKRGLNITINIIQMLFYIVDERYDDVLDKLSSLRQYNFRYLKRPEYARSSNFIKMLLKIPEGDYNPKKIRAKATKYHQALLDNPSDYSEHALSIEIIPYEQLWEEIMSIF